MNEVAEFEQVSVLVKVTGVEEKIEVKPNLWKQDVYVADATSSTRVVLWQENIGKLEVSNSYMLKGITVRSFDGLKYLTPSKSSCCMVPHEDVGDVAEAVVQKDNNMDNVRDLGVLCLENTRACRKCVDGKVEPKGCLIGECKKCKS